MEALASAIHALTSGWAIPAAFMGVLWGIFGGALPGISPSIAMALLLPLTYGMEPISAIVLLASVYVGAEYGGSIPAILIRTPGTNAAAATVVDGYAMKLLNDATDRGVYPSLEVAKSALYAAMPPGSDWPEFREH